MVPDMEINSADSHSGTQVARFYAHGQVHNAAGYAMHILNLHTTATPVLSVCCVFLFYTIKYLLLITIAKTHIFPYSSFLLHSSFFSALPVSFENKICWVGVEQ